MNVHVYSCVSPTFTTIGCHGHGSEVPSRALPQPAAARPVLGNDGGRGLQLPGHVAQGGDLYTHAVPGVWKPHCGMVCVVIVRRDCTCTSTFSNFFFYL